VQLADLHPCQFSLIRRNRFPRRCGGREDKDSPQIARRPHRDHQQRPQGGLVDGQTGLLADFSDTGRERIFAGLQLAADAVPRPGVRRVAAVDEQDAGISSQEAQRAQRDQDGPAPRAPTASIASRSSRTNCSRWATRSPGCSSNATSALPTMTPSAISATRRA